MSCTGDDAVAHVDFGRRRFAQVIDIDGCDIRSRGVMDIEVGVRPSEEGSDGVMGENMFAPVQIDAVGSAVADFGVPYIGIDILQNQSIEGVVMDSGIAHREMRHGVGLFGSTEQANIAAEYINIIQRIVMLGCIFRLNKIDPTPLSGGYSVRNVFKEFIQSVSGYSYRFIGSPSCGYASVKQQVGGRMEVKGRAFRKDGFSCDDERVENKIRFVVEERKGSVDDAVPLLGMP